MGNHGELFARELWGETKTLFNGSVGEMEKFMRSCEESETQVSVHCQPLQTLRGCRYAQNQSGSFILHDRSINCQFLIMHATSPNIFIHIYELIKYHLLIMIVHHIGRAISSGEA